MSNIIYLPKVEPIVQITEAEFADNIDLIRSDAMWRITSGKFYKIMIKEPNENDDTTRDYAMQFVPNDMQMWLLDNLWYRMVIPKARQFGITTLFCLMYLDHALFVPNQRCGIIAQNMKKSTGIFRDKVKYGYDNLPEFMRDLFPADTDRADELLFAHNNSSIQVAASLRSGTTHRLHISEYAKICADTPKQAREVRTGSIPSVPLNGMTVIESTGEGPDGDFYNKVMQASDLEEDTEHKLTKRDFKLFFIPWWKHNDYRMPEGSANISPEDEAYFDKVEAEMNVTLDQEQCEWYIATRDADYPEEHEMMWQEYPSTLNEAFQKSKEGHWFAKQMTAMRKSGRIKSLPTEIQSPCWSFWDIGNTDGTAIWVIQRIGHEFRAIKFYEAWGEPYAHAIAWLQSLGLVFEEMFLPHDADHVRQGKTTNKSPRTMLEELAPGWRWTTVDRIEDVTWGIQQTRDVMPLLWIDADECKEGIIHLDQYKKKWNTVQQTFIDVPEKATGHSEAADALRQFGQAKASNILNIRTIGKPKKPRGWKTV